jgi:hypothetical protein
MLSDLDQTYFARKGPTIAGAKVTEKLSEELGPKIIRPHKDLESFRLSIQNTVGLCYAKPDSLGLSNH